MGKKDYNIIPAHMTPAQHQMQRDMEGMKAGRIIDGMVDGAISKDEKVIELALGVIGTVYDSKAHFSLRQWGIIQNLVERGVIAGHNHLVDELEDEPGHTPRW